MAGIFGLLMSGAGVIKDQYFNLTSLLLPGNGTNGAQNNTFLDSGTANSGSGFTITRNGNTTQGTFSPFSQTGWGGYFSAVSNYIRSTSNVSSITGDFTIECWVYWSASTGSKIITALSADSIDFWISAPTGTISYYTGAATRITTTLTASQNDWTHIALVRSSGVTTIYIDGIADSATYTSSATIGSGSEFLYIGRDSGTSFMAGYISNFRLVVGRAVYTSNFTPSITPLGNTTGGQNPPQGTETKLLTLQSNRFVDNASSGLGISVVGSPSVTPFSPFAPTQSYSASAVGGSGYFDGTGDYLNTTTTQIIPSGSFTVETWAYPTTSSDGYLVAQGTTGNSARFSVGIESNVWYVQIGASRVSSSAAPNLNSWTHIAATFNGSTLTLYVNGQSVGTPASTSTNAQNTTLRIGSLGPVDWAALYWTGYIGQIRISNTVRSISVPTAPYTSDANTNLLLNFTNAGVVDATAKNVLETVGNAQISTTQSKWGGGSIRFDGTSNTSCMIAQGRWQPFFGGNFSIEMWFRVDALSGVQTLISQDWRRGIDGPKFALFIGEASSDRLTYFANSGAISIIAGAGNAISANTWYFVQVIKSGSTTTMYLNGTSIGSAADTYTYPVSTYATYIGRSDPGGSVQGYLTGYIDDLRVTVGQARTAGTATAPFPLQ